MAAVNNYVGNVKSFVPEITFNVSDGQSIPLCFYDQASQQFEFNKDVAEVLLPYGGNVGFVINIGQRGVGKSYMLNNILDLNDSGNKFEERTPGIRLWTKPIKKESEFLFTFFIDVQGFDHDQFFRNFVWTVAFMLGSVIIYSTAGPLTDRLWTDLSSFDFISSHVIISENALENDYSLSYYAPKVLMLVKDTNLPVVDGKPMTADAYFESVVYGNSRSQNMSQATAYSKQFFINAFKDRSTIVVPPAGRPIGFNENLQRSSPGFAEAVKISKERLYSRMATKYFDGIAMSSRMILNFFSIMIDLYNSQSQIVYYDV